MTDKHWIAVDQAVNQESVYRIRQRALTSLRDSLEGQSTDIKSYIDALEALLLAKTDANLHPDDMTRYMRTLAASEQDGQNWLDNNPEKWHTLTSREQKLPNLQELSDFWLNLHDTDPLAESCVSKQGQVYGGLPPPSTKESKWSVANPTGKHFYH